MKNNSQTRNKSKYLTNIGFRFLLLCILLTSHLSKISAENGFMLLQSTDVTLNLTNVSLETLFKTPEKWDSNCPDTSRPAVCNWGQMFS